MELYGVMESTDTKCCATEPEEVDGNDAVSTNVHEAASSHKKSSDRQCRPRVETQPGIVYLSQIPAFMKPKRIQQIFSSYGLLGRSYLQPEDRYMRKVRKKKGGSKARSFSEGWVEFKDKRIAKRVALTLNTTRVSGRKRSRHYDDLWSVKYLHRFQWAHLAGQLEHEKQVVKQRMRAEISQAKHETGIYLSKVEKGDMLDRLEKKRKRQGSEWTHRKQGYPQRVVREGGHEGGRLRSGKVTGSLLGRIFVKS